MIDLDQLRLAQNLHRIRRFQTHHILEEDNVANHSFRAVSLYIFFGGTEPIPMMYHDLEESITSDIPSPVKKDIQGLEMFELIRPQWQDQKQRKLGKMCDKLDLVCVLQEQQLTTGTLTTKLLDILDAERELVLDIASELGLKRQVTKFLADLRKPHNTTALTEKLRKEYEELKKKKEPEVK